MALWPASVTRWPPEREARQEEVRQGSVWPWTPRPYFNPGSSNHSSISRLWEASTEASTSLDSRSVAFSPARQATDTPALVGLEGSSGPSPLLAHPALPSDLTTCLGIFIAAHGGTGAG